MRGRASHARGPRGDATPRVGRLGAAERVARRRARAPGGAVVGRVRALIGGALAAWASAAWAQEPAEPSDDAARSDPGPVLEPALGVGGARQWEQGLATGSAEAWVSLVQMFAALAFVVALLVVLAWVMRRLQGWSRHASGERLPIELVGQRALGARERLVVVEVDGQRVLLGVGAGRIEALHRWSVSEAGASTRRSVGADGGDPVSPGGGRARSRASTADAASAAPPESASGRWTPGPGGARALAAEPEAAALPAYPANHGAGAVEDLAACPESDAVEPYVPDAFAAGGRRSAESRSTNATPGGDAAHLESLGARGPRERQVLRGARSQGPGGGAAGRREVDGGTMTRLPRLQARPEDRAG